MPTTLGDVSTLFVEQAHTLSEVYVALGCPLAGLTRDLRQESDALKTDVAKVYSMQFQWLVHQFRLASLSMAVAKENSCALMAGYHGSITLAYPRQGESALGRDCDRAESRDR